VDPSGKETVLYSFSGGADGSEPSSSGVVRDSARNLYGTTFSGGNGYRVGGYGVVYKIDPNGAETVLHAFTYNGADGYGPTHGVILDSAGNLYGTTLHGGVNKFGVVYKLGPGGQGTTLFSFAEPGGLYPQGGVILR
jgi:uncharacterized repeat protein (TIGR03803 family)